MGVKERMWRVIKKMYESSKKWSETESCLMQSACSVYTSKVDLSRLDSEHVKYVNGLHFKEVIIIIDSSMHAREKFWERLCSQLHGIVLEQIS